MNDAAARDHPYPGIGTGAGSAARLLASVCGAAAEAARDGPERTREHDASARPDGFARAGRRGNAQQQLSEMARRAGMDEDGMLRELANGGAAADLVPEADREEVLRCLGDDVPAAQDGLMGLAEGLAANAERALERAGDIAEGIGVAAAPSL